MRALGVRAVVVPKNGSVHLVVGPAADSVAASLNRALNGGAAA